MVETSALEGGFADAPREAAFAFRALMNAMARPGRIESVEGAVPPGQISVAAGTLLLTLADPETPIYLAGAADCEDVRRWIAFHTGAPLVGPGVASFALGGWDDLLPLEAYPFGTPDYPDRSTTLVVECETLSGTGNTLSGPGIKDSATLSLPDADALRANNARFPLGLDFYFTCGSRLAALPRSTRID